MKKLVFTASGAPAIENATLMEAANPLVLPGDSASLFIKLGLAVAITTLVVR